MSTEQGSWFDRMADGLATDCNNQIDKITLKAALEAAGEIKAVRLKILLARSYEVMAESISTRKPVNVAEGFIESVFKEIEL